MTDGSIIYVSESVTSLLEHLPVSIQIVWSPYLMPILNVLEPSECWTVVRMGMRPLNMSLF